MCVVYVYLHDNNNDTLLCVFLTNNMIEFVNNTKTCYIAILALLLICVLVRNEIINLHKKQLFKMYRVVVFTLCVNLKLQGLRIAPINLLA